MSANGVAGRLIRLEERLRPVGCPACRHWDGTVIADEGGDVTRPERCGGCGRTVPYALVVALHGVALADV